MDYKPQQHQKNQLSFLPISPRKNLLKGLKYNQKVDQSGNIKCHLKNAQSISSQYLPKYKLKNPIKINISDRSMNSLSDIKSKKSYKNNPLQKIVQINNKYAKNKSIDLNMNFQNVYKKSNFANPQEQRKQYHQQKNLREIHKSFDQKIFSKKGSISKKQLRKSQEMKKRIKIQNFFIDQQENKQFDKKISKFLTLLHKDSDQDKKYESQKQQKFFDVVKKHFFELKNNLNDTFQQKCSCELFRINNFYCHRSYMIMQKFKDFDVQYIFENYNNILTNSYFEEELLQQIDKDITRTFSIFGQGKQQQKFQQLKRVLMAISTYQNIGYVQGMNFIAASLLQHCNEEFAYYILEKLFKRIKAEKNYDDKLKGVQIKADEFFEILQKKQYYINENLDQKQIPKQIIMLDWFITLGFNIVPLEKNMDLISNIFEGSWNSLFQIISNYLKYIYPFFKDSSFGDTIKIIKKNKNIKIDWNKIFEINQVFSQLKIIKKIKFQKGQIITCKKNIQMTAPLVCDQATIFSTAMTWQQKCEQLSPICGEDQETFNFFKLYMCDFQGNNILWGLFIFLLVVILFKFICSTIDEYVSPGIVYLSEKLQLSEALAGVTLLAFANGAGDVVTAIVASNSKDGISYNVGALYGAGFFVLTLVVAFTIILSPVKIVVNKSVIYRDIGFYILATLLTLFMAYRGQISQISSLFMLFLYLVYVLVVVVQDKYEKKEETQIESMQNMDDQDLSQQRAIDAEDDSDDEERKKLLHAFIRDQQLSLPSKLSRRYLQYEMMMNKESIRAEDEGMFGKMIDIIDLPFYYIRLLTIPPSNQDEYEHQYTKYWAFFGVFFLGLYMGANHIMHFILLLAISFLLYFVFSRHKDDSLPSYFFLIVLLSVYIGILWTKICSGLLVDLLTQIGRIANISTTYLGLTVIAIGNALPDGLTTVSIAKRGQAIMGLTGGIAGQLFGFLIGFGIAMFKMTTRAGGSLPFDLFNPKKLHENLLDLIVVLIALTTLCFIFFYGIFNNYLFDKKMAYILITFYLAMIAITTTVVIIQS